MNDLDSRLRNQIRHRAGSASVTGMPLADVVARGRQRQRRARIATSGLMAAGVIGGVLGSVAWLDSRDAGSGPDVAISAGTSATGAPGDAAVTAELGPLEFRRVDAVDRLGSVRSLATSDDGVVYALSTAPGTTDTDVDGQWEPAPQAIYRAKEGGGWDALPLGGELRLQGLAVSANRLYGVGTAPAAAALAGDEAQSDAVVAWSDDDGTTWSTSILPFRPEGVDPSIRTWVGDSSVAVGDAGIVVVLTTWADLDIESRLPDGTDLSYGYEVDGDGVTLWGPPTSVGDDVRQELEAQFCEPEWALDIETVTCIAPDSDESIALDPVAIFSGLEPAATYSWDQLGLSPDVGRLVNGVPQMFHSSDGESFQAVTDGLVADGSVYDFQVTAVPDGFLAAAQLYDTSAGFGYFEEATSRTALWRSADGVTWTPIDSATSPELEWATTSGSLGDRLAIGGHGPDGPVIATTGDGTSWTSTDPSDLVTADAAATVDVTNTAISDGGIAVAMREFIDPVAAAGGVDIAVDGYTLRILDSNGRAVLLDGAGTEVVALDSIWEVSGPHPMRAVDTTAVDGLEGNGAAEEAADSVITDPDTGEALVSVPQDSIWAAMEEATVSAEDAGGTVGRGWVAWSPDGMTWSLTDITPELTDGNNVGVRGVYVGGSTITVELSERVESSDAEDGGVETSRTLVAPIPG